MEALVDEFVEYESDLVAASEKLDEGYGIPFLPPTVVEKNLSLSPCHLGMVGDWEILIRAYGKPCSRVGGF